MHANYLNYVFGSLDVLGHLLIYLHPNPPREVLSALIPLVRPWDVRMTFKEPPPPPSEIHCELGEC